MEKLVPFDVEVGKADFKGHAMIYVVGTDRAGVWAVASVKFQEPLRGACSKRENAGVMKG